MICDVNEAVNQYNYVYKLARKQYFKDKLHKHNPYVECLEDLIDINTFARKEIGSIEVPTKLIVGTLNKGRQVSFASNFMPLFSFDSEFASKWMAVCRHHLSDEGINEAPKVYEYLGKFYVEEGNKRVSVLKSYGAVYIQCEVIRLLPQSFDSDEYKLYKEFLDFYALSSLYSVQFKKIGYYLKLQRLLMFEENHHWERRQRIEFIGLYERISEVLRKKKIEADYNDSLVVLLEIYGYDYLLNMTDKELNKAIEESKRRLIYDKAHFNIFCVADEEDMALWNGLYNKELKQYDLIISCGDLKAEYLEYLVTISNSPLLYVRGNHDESYDTKPPEGCVCIDDDLYEIDGVRILGLGGSFRYKADGKYMYSEKEMAKRIKKLKHKIKRSGGIDIVVAHGPVKGYGDLDDYAHQGFECFKDLIKKYHPKYFLFGHVHIRYDVSKKSFYEYEGTQIINVSGKQRIVF